MRKVISLLLIIVLLLSVCITANAESSATLNGDASVKVGSDIEFTVNVSGCADATSLAVAVNFDDGFELVSGTWLISGGLSTFNVAKKQGGLGALSSSDVNRSIFKFTLKAKTFFVAPQNVGVNIIVKNGKNVILDVTPTKSIKISCSHAWNSGEVTKTATCKETGTKTYTCSICGDTKTETIPKTQTHSFGASKLEKYPTCTEKGYTTHTCLVCGKSSIDQYIAAIGHDIKHHDAKDPTCIENGWDAYDTCSRCDYTTYNELPALGHDYDAVVTDPTCTEQGYITHTCSRCGDTYVDTYVDALGHDYGEITVIEPDYQNEGYSTHTCAKCGYEEKFDFVPALTYIPGDVNGDETVNDSDAVYLLMYVFFPEDYPINQSGDFNGDNSVNDSDAVYLLMYVFFPEDYPLA